MTAFQSPTGGSDDWYLVISSSEDSEGNPNVDSPVFRWNGEQFEETEVCKEWSYGSLTVMQNTCSGCDFSHSITHSQNITNHTLTTKLLFSQMLATIGASALDVFSISGTVYLAVVSQTDTRSSVFVWTSGETFRLHQTFDSEEAVDVAFVSLGEVSHLAVASREWLTALLQDTLKH